MVTVHTGTINLPRAVMSLPSIEPSHCATCWIRWIQCMEAPWPKGSGIVDHRVLCRARKSPVSHFHKHTATHTPSTTHRPAWFYEDPHFVGQVADLLWLHFPECVCIRMFTPGVQVYRKLSQPHNTTKYGPQMVVPLPGQLSTFDIVYELATMFSLHNVTGSINNTTQLGRKGLAAQWRVCLRTAHSNLTTLGGAMLAALIHRPTSTTSCFHGCVKPLTQQKLVDPWTVQFMPQGRMEGVFHCDNINDTLNTG